MDNLIYWVARFAYVFGMMFFYPVMIYSAVNDWLFGIIVLMVLVACWGLGWVWQDMYKPSPRRKPGESEETYDHLI